jgi:hypothetical protein
MLNYEICHYVLLVSFTLETETCWCNKCVWHHLDSKADYLPAPISKKSASKFSDLASNKFMKGNVNKGVVCHTVALPIIYIKKYIKAKEELWKLKYFTMQKYNPQKKSSKTNQNPSKHYNSITNLKFEHKPKYHLSKILI